MQNYKILNSSNLDLLELSHGMKIPCRAFDAPGQDLTEFCNNLSALRDLNELICDWDIQCPWICNLEPAKSYSLSSRYKAGLWTNIQEQGAC